MSCPHCLPSAFLAQRGLGGREMLEWVEVHVRVFVRGQGRT